MKEYVKYQFPARVAQLFLGEDEELSSINLDQVKKRILLELQLSKNQTVELNSSIYTKNDILGLFASLENTSDLNFHLIIERTPFLHNILSAESSTDIKKEPIELAFDSEDEKQSFINFISPYLAFAINRISKKLIEEKKYDLFIHLIGCRKFIKSEDFHYTFKKLISHYREFVQFGWDVKKGLIKKIRTRDFLFFNDPSYFRAAGLLDDELPDLPDQMAYGVTQIVDNFENSSHRNKLFFNGLTNVLRIIENPSWRTHLNQNIAYFQSKLGVKGLFSKRTRRIIVAALIALFIFLAILSQSGGDTKSTPGNLLSVMRTERFDLMDYGTYLMDSTLRPKLDSAEIQLIHDFVSDTSILTPRIKTISSKGVLRGFKSRFTKQSTVQLENHTSRLALFIVKDRTTIQSIYVPPNHYSPVTVSGPSDVLVYTGQQWDFQSAWSYTYIIPEKSDTTSVYMTGAFLITTEKDQALLTKEYRLYSFMPTYLLMEDSDSLWFAHE